MRKGFTLIELLVVIAIIAILAVVVVLTLNPAQLLAQSRDSQRVSDMATLNSAINLYQTDQSGASAYSLGTASTSYLSLPDASSTCSHLGMATSAFSYACSTNANYRLASSSGWLPVNFQNISSGSPFGSLPVDPTNQTSSNLFYSYETNGTVFVLSSFMESAKYAKLMASTGGADPALYEIGSGAATLPDASRGLAGYWPLNEGTGSSTIDWSGYGNAGTWTGTPTGTSGYYSPGKPWQWAGAFDGTTTLVSIGNPVPLNAAFTALTMAGWINVNASQGSDAGLFGKFAQYSLTDHLGATFYSYINTGGNYTNAPTAGYTGGWHFLTQTFDGTTIRLYVDGNLVSSHTSSAGSVGTGGSFLIGSASSKINGFISDVRVYDRVLSPAEIQQIYNAEK